MQPVDAGLPGPGRGLVRGDDQLPQPVPPVQRAERGHHRQRRAVGVGDDPLRPDRGPASALTSGTTSGTSGSIRNAPELSTTTAPRAAATGAHSRRHLVRHVEHGHVDAVEDLRRQRLHGHVLAAHPQPSARPSAARRSAGSRPTGTAARTGSRASRCRPRRSRRPRPASAGRSPALRVARSSAGPRVDGGLPRRRPARTRRARPAPPGRGRCRGPAPRSGSPRWRSSRR